MSPAVVGLGVTLAALSDLLLGRGGWLDTRQAVFALRAAVQTRYLGVFVWWAAANGGGIARFALASGLVLVALFYWFRWAHEADRRDEARRATGDGST